MQICPVCFWEDAPGEYPYNHSNSVTLREAQLNFLTIGAAQEAFLNIVRPPTASEARSEHWMSAETLRLKVIEMIATAFSKVMLGDGISLHQADALDDYADQTTFTKAREHDPETNWQCISDTKIEKFHESMVFLDALGFRFYLPAFITFALKSYNSKNGDIRADGVLFALTAKDDYYAEGLSLLDHPQKQAVPHF